MKRGYIDICKVLIEKYVNVNKIDWKGCIFLYWVFKRGYFDIVIILFKNKVFLNNKNDKEKVVFYCVV